MPTKAMRVFQAFDILCFTLFVICGTLSVVNGEPFWVVINALWAGTTLWSFVRMEREIVERLEE